MSYGEITKQDVLVQGEIIFSEPTAPINDNPFKKCCYDLNVFADSADSDSLKNDNSNIIKIIPKQYTVSMNLQKLVSGSWATQAALTDNTYGTFYAQGFESKGNNDYIGYALSWRTVLSGFGTGRYRIQFDAGSSNEFYSEEYCLRNYSALAIDGSVRIKYLWNSVIGDKNQKLQRDFAGINWWNEIRLMPTIFGFKSGSFESEQVRYQNGKERSISKGFREEYQMIIKQLPSELHDVVVNDILMSDDIKITDYNSQNAASFVDVEVEVQGGYEPNYSDARVYPNVTVNFIDKYDNRRKLYS